MLVADIKTVPEQICNKDWNNLSKAVWDFLWKYFVTE